MPTLPSNRTDCDRVSLRDRQPVVTESADTIALEGIRVSPRQKWLLGNIPQLREWLVSRLVRRQFQSRFGYPLNLDSPSSYTEKLNWTKIHGQLERYAPFVDKYSVRNYVSAVAPEAKLIPLLALADRAAEINWDALPERFVLKATHGSGWNVIVTNKSTVDRTKTETVLEHWLARNYFHYSLEAQYLHVPPRIMIEAFLGDSGEVPPDYKIHCYGGEPRFVQIDYDRHQTHTQTVHDTDWNIIPVRMSVPRFTGSSPRPAELTDMLDIARQLSRPFPYVRVDLYTNAGHIYFGELTFTPNNGMTKFTPSDFDHTFGESIDVSAYQRPLNLPPEFLHLA